MLEKLLIFCQKDIYLEMVDIFRYLSLTFQENLYFKDMLTQNHKNLRLIGENFRYLQNQKNNTTDY